MTELQLQRALSRILTGRGTRQAELSGNLLRAVAIRCDVLARNHPTASPSSPCSASGSMRPRLGRRLYAHTRRPLRERDRPCSCGRDDLPGSDGPVLEATEEVLNPVAATMRVAVQRLGLAPGRGGRDRGDDVPFYQLAPKPVGVISHIGDEALGRVHRLKQR